MRANWSWWQNLLAVAGGFAILLVAIALGPRATVLRDPRPAVQVAGSQHLAEEDQRQQGRGPYPHPPC